MLLLRPPSTMPRSLPLLSPTVLLLPTLLLMQPAIIPVEAQIQAPACLPAGLHVWNWTYNSLNQSPCQTAAYLAAQCNNGQCTIPQLAQGSYYTGPSGSDAGDMCRCNSVYYSLISACVGCQRGVWIPYDEWYANCTTVAPMSTFPESINNDTGVPAWAFVNVSDTTRWDNVTAYAVGDSPESTGTSRPSFAPKFDNGDAVRVGVIVGLALACTVLLFTLVGTGAWFFLRRYRRRRQPNSQTRSGSPSARPRESEQENGSRTVVVRAPDVREEFIAPSDPSTPPVVGVLPTGALNLAEFNSATQAKEPTTAKKHGPPEYSGLPEPPSYDTVLTLTLA